MPGQISIVGVSGFIAESYVTAFLARVSRTIRADFFRAAVALEHAAGGHAFWDRGPFSRGSYVRDDIRKRWGTTEGFKSVTK